MTSMEPIADVSSAVIFVTDLNKSAQFYSEVFRCTVSLHETDAALLLTAAGFQIYLIAKGTQAARPTEGVGDRHLLWTTESQDALNVFEQRLRERDALTDTHTSGGVTFVQGRDPDGIRVVIAHPTPAQAPRSVIDSRLYN